MSMYRVYVCINTSSYISRHYILVDATITHLITATATPPPPQRNDLPPTHSTLNTAYTTRLTTSTLHVLKKYAYVYIYTYVLYRFILFVYIDMLSRVCMYICIHTYLYVIYIYTYVAYQTLWIHRVIFGYIVYLPRRKIFEWWPLIVFGGLFRCPVMT